MVRRRTLAAGLAGLAAVAVVIGVSIVWPGLDARETPAVDANVWVLQTGEGRSYARLNTAIGELDTVRSVGNPSGVTQSGTGAFLFSESFGKLTRIDETQPVDLDEDVLRQSESTPAGTTEVRAAGDFVVYRTDTGALWTGRLSTGSPSQLDPDGSGGEDAPQYTSDAVVVDDRGIVYSYSRADGAVLRYDIQSSTVKGRDVLDLDTSVTVPLITGIADDWLVLDSETGDAWLRGEELPIDTGTVGSRILSQAVATGSAFYVADDSGLVRVSVDGADVERIVGDGSATIGTPARPVTFQDTTYAAWLPGSGAGGLLWTSEDGQLALDYGDEELSDQRRPVFVVGTGAIALNEMRSGWVWTIPDGALVPSSQDWTLDDQIDPASEESDEQATVVIDPKPPVAGDDSFGVRSGSLVALPVLLNDHDPNVDVLSIDPESVTGLDPGFGSVAITDNGQRLAVHIADGATGTATLIYRVTDGTSEGGLYSPPATITLTVVGPTANAAPAWCGVEGCLATWPTPEVGPGGTVSVPVLSGWVDPDGDPLLLLSVENRSGVGVVAATPSGEVVYQHSDDGVTGDQSIQLDVTVADTRGATTTRPLFLRVAAQPRLTAQSFTLVDALSGGLTVDVAPHVTGTAGRLTLSSVRVLDDAPATAVAATGGTAFDFTARETGTYRVAFTVSDGSGEATGTARITILADDSPAQIATAPVVAFVHPQEDVTVDVFEAVSNPTRRVLLLSDIVPVPESGASLSVDTVGQNFMRVSGTTATGAPGQLGTVRYVVSDGTEDEGARVEGEATVYLLPSAPELAPIAVEDRVVVRAGAQLDIPVLANDVAPSGSPLTLNPVSVVSSTPDALAFASGDVLRYLAPTEPGDYTIEYSVFASGQPSLADTALVRVTVMPNDANRAPLPETLEGRVLSGQATTISFDDFSVDPDGDVVSLDAIVSQPAALGAVDQTPAGSATISADGSSIVYSSVPGFRGQVTFRYRVIDGFGATGVGTVRVGVLDAQSNPSPVTFTDYVQVQVGGSNSVRVHPVANDVDPTGGQLRLTAVRPDLADTLADGDASPEFDRLDALIGLQDDASVEIRAGNAPGTMSFLYDVESDSGNTARGLIVVKVVREAVPNYPVAADTVLTAETREQFPGGVDVVTGKVSWSGGDASELSLSLWGEPSGVGVDGWELSGSLPRSTRVIPFALTGPGEDGPVTTYGFLRIPGERDVKLALRSDAAAQDVTEGESVAFDVAALVSVPRDASLEVGTDVAAAGGRPAASCTAQRGTTVRYEAGAGAPWVDACHVPVRLEGTTEWTYISVPIRVRAVEPVPELRPASLTVAPGDTATFDLGVITSWQGAAQPGSLVYALDYAGTDFTVTQEGAVLTITGADGAVPGRDEVAMISLPSHVGVAPARLILRVGAAPSTLPQGGTLAQSCSQAAGSSCAITVVGASGEVNPLPRTPLRLVSVRPTGACTGISFAVASATTVVATWTADAPGATCSAAFSVRDAQGRTTNSDRDGAVLLDLQGYPQVPAAIRQAAYADGQVTLRVDPGNARLAYPALTGFVVRYAGSVVATCTVDGVCPTLAAPNGEERAYEAVAVNAVGESRGSVRTVAWAYDVPETPAGITSTPLVTGGEGGLISLSIESVDDEETGYLEISSPVGDTTQVSISRGQSSVVVPVFRVGANTATPVTIVPHSRYPIPPGLGGTTSGATVVVYANGIGAPTGVALTLTSSSNGNGTSTVQAQVVGAPGGDGAQVRFDIVRDGQSCVPSRNRAAVTFDSLPDGEVYAFTACADSWFDGRSFGSASASGSVRAVQSTQAPGGYTFQVGAQPVYRGNSAAWVIADAPTSAEPVPNRNVVQFQGGPPTSVIGRDPGIQVRYTHTEWGTSSDWALVTPRSGSAPYQVGAQWSLASCEGGADLVPTGTSSGSIAAVSFDPAALVYYDEAGAVLPHNAGTWAVPVGAARVAGIGVSVDWSAQGWGLNTATASFGGACAPNNPPAPEPAP